MSELTLVIGNKNYSSWSMRPWVLLKQLGIPFEEVRIPFHTPGMGRDDRALVALAAGAGALARRAVRVGLARDHGSACTSGIPQKDVWPQDAAGAGLRALGLRGDALGLPRPAHQHADEHPRARTRARAHSAR